MTIPRKQPSYETLVSKMESTVHNYVNLIYVEM